MEPPSVLLVDDEQEILDALSRTLRHDGYRFFEATSGAKALSTIANEPIDLLVTDIDMPTMSGLDLVERVRGTHPHIARIILTGVASLSSALRAINDGEVQRFLTKPWDKDELRAAVRESLARRDARRESRRSLSEDGQLHGRQSFPEEMAEALSPRLRDMLGQLMTGAGEKEIADRLGLSPHTAHQYVKTLYRRFKVGSRAQLMVKMQRRDALEAADLPNQGNGAGSPSSGTVRSGNHGR
jgi:DNA-binding NarL/FixJ family response regulator